MKSVGPISVGTYLPPQIRGNDWWPSATVEQWRKKAIPFLPSSLNTLGITATEGTLKTLDGLSTVNGDPFYGSKFRHILADDLSSSDMEAEAAKKAIAKAGLKP